MPIPSRLRSAVSHRAMRRLVGLQMVCTISISICALAQTPYMNAGPDSGFAQIDFAQMYLDQISKHLRETAQQKAQDKELVDSGAVSALDLSVPNKAVEQYNTAITLLKAQNSKEAIKHLQKAIAAYHPFVSAHMCLGVAYLDQDDLVAAKSEFEQAAKLDGKFAAPLVNLGLLALSAKDFSAAQVELQKAAALQSNARTLSALVYAENGAHEYARALDTVKRVHAMEHKGLANVHYVAASAALSLNDFESVERELKLFLSEDATNAFAPIARQNLAILSHNREVRATSGSGQLQKSTAQVQPASQQTFPNSDRLKAQLSALGDDADSGTCSDCNLLAEADTKTEALDEKGASPGLPGVTYGGAAWTIRKSVDEVVLFLAVSNHGHMVNDLDVSDIKIRDDNKDPERVVQFTPQSKLPLRLALLVDTSGSVHDRFGFEKSAAARFLDRVLNPASDLGFVAGFANEPAVMQDFTADTGDLGKGVDKLTNGGGTALFDAVSFACWKLAKYPDHERVARVVVILSDGEDNSSHISLKQALQVAERTGVTIYAISTREEIREKSDSDKILEALAEDSGGEAMFPGDMVTLGKSFDKLRDVIRSRYFIAYAPADFQPNGTYRTIKVIAEKDGKRLQVRSRKGYHARLEAR